MTEGLPGRYYDFASARKRNVKVEALRGRVLSDQWSIDDIDWTAAKEVVPAELLQFSGGLLLDDSPLTLESLPRFHREVEAWTVSNYFHGEYGGLAALSRLVTMLPDLEGRLFVTAQLVDESRHVDVFLRYLERRVHEPYGINPGLAALIDGACSESRWEFVYLAIHVILEGIAFANLRLASASVADPLLLDISERISRDEARHVAFGELALREVARQLSERELLEREEFLLEAISLMYERLMLREVWERLGVGDAGVSFTRKSALLIRHRQGVFARVITTLSRIGFLTPRIRSELTTLQLL